MKIKKLGLGYKILLKEIVLDGRNYITSFVIHSPQQIRSREMPWRERAVRIGEIRYARKICRKTRRAETQSYMGG
jgi:hypothetical protein